MFSWLKIPALFLSLIQKFRNQRCHIAYADGAQDISRVMHAHIQAGECNQYCHTEGRDAVAFWQDAVRDEGNGKSQGGVSRGEGKPFWWFYQRLQ